MNDIVGGGIPALPLDSDRWRWSGEARPAFGVHLGRECATFPDAFGLAVVEGVELTDGVIEMDLAVIAERSFHGVGWHVADGANYESFFVRPHQVRNPDAIQYTPVTNGISSWQLYHGPGFWAPIDFPVAEWFTLRVAFAGRQAQVHVGDLARPALEIADLKLSAQGGGVGILVGGPGLSVARFAWSDRAPRLPGPTGPQQRSDGIIAAWMVSEPFVEAAIERELATEKRWTRLDAEPSGLVDLARASGLSGDRNTVFARATLTSVREQVTALELGFSDRAVVFLNGRPLFRGDDSYRSRDYRFLGSIGYWDTIYLPLREGANELVVAVSETFGGWGIQGRVSDRSGIEF